MNKKSNNKIISFILSVLMILGIFTQNIPTFAQGSDKYPGADIVDSLTVSPKNIGHTGNFTIAFTFSGQSEDSNHAKYIYPGKEIFIPIIGDGVAYAQLNSTVPQLENTSITVDGQGIRIRFLEGIKNQYDISGNFRVTMSGLNTEEDSTHSITIGRDHIVNITNGVAGERGVFAGKTGVMYGEIKPGYVTWFLRGNINGDNWPGGPLHIHDKLGDGQELDGTGISIGLYWGGQQHKTYEKIYSSIEEFLADPNYGRAAGSIINYNKLTKEIDITIPEAVLTGKEFSFTYDALVTNHDLYEFINSAEFDFYERGEADSIHEIAKVINIDVGGEIFGKTRAAININKVIRGTQIPISGVQFEVVREDGQPLFEGKSYLKTILITDSKGQIRAKGFKPGKIILREVGAPNWIKYDPQKKITLDIAAGNKSNIENIENDVIKVNVEGIKTWEDKNNQDGKRSEEIMINLLKNGEKLKSKRVTKEDGWKWNFENLDKYENGELITYTISEEKVEGYSTEIEGYNVKNMYTPGKTSVQVTKAWEDNNNQDGVRPESIKVKLYADGQEVSGKTLALTKANNWTDTFTDLDEYKEGHKIEYTVKEETVGLGYTSIVTGNSKEGFTVTNILKPKIPHDKKDKKLTKTGASIFDDTFTIIKMLVLALVIVFFKILKKEEYNK